MKPPPFRYYAPVSLAEALSYLTEYGAEAKALAGGQSLIPAMNFRLAQPEILVDLNHIPELAYIRPMPDGGVSIGAMTRQRQVERSAVVAERAPLVYETMPYIAHPQIRNRGTFGGSIAHADPAAELPAVIVALGGRCRVQSQAGERWLPAGEFYTGLFETAVGPGELLVEVALPPLPPRAGYAFREVSRRHGDYALVGVAAVVTLDDRGLCQQVRLVYLSVGDGPIEAHQAAAALDGQALTPEVIQAAAETASAADIDPPADIHASVRYRRHLAKVLARQVLAEAGARAKGDSRD
jgi:carbon-monoxide dehydrogenase medium subunit